MSKIKKYLTMIKYKEKNIYFDLFWGHLFGPVYNTI